MNYKKLRAKYKYEKNMKEYYKEMYEMFKKWYKDYRRLVNEAIKDIEEKNNLQKQSIDLIYKVCKLLKEDIDKDIILDVIENWVEAINLNQKIYHNKK